MLTSIQKLTKNKLLTMPFYNIDFQAGLASPDNSNQLKIALEPEAAAITCRQRKLWDFADGEKKSFEDPIFPAKTQYLVIDNGGKQIFKQLR